jgi:tetratricopeptide (TPR) repeat protein
VTQPEPVPRWRLRVEGARATLESDAGPVPLSLRARVTLAYLALAGPTPRESLARLLWPDASEPRARGNLRQLLHRLRAIGDVVGGDPLRLADGVEVLPMWSDHGATHGAGMDEVDLDPDRFGELGTFFTLQHQRRVTATVMDQERAYRAAAAEGRWEDALAHARRLLSIDPAAEGATRLVMTAQLELGLPRDALLSYRHCREALAAAVGEQPSAETRAVAERAAVAAARPGDRRGAGVGAGRGGSVARSAAAGGWLEEGVALLRTAAAAAATALSEGRRLVELAWLEHQLGRGDVAARAAESGLALLEREGDRAGVAEACFVLGSVARHRGAVDEARAYWRRALAASTGAADPAARLALHLNVAMVEDALDDAAAARDHYLAALQAARALGDGASEAIALNNLAHGALDAGRRDEARTLTRAARSLAERSGDRQLLACVLDGAARAELACGEAAGARALAARAYLIAHEDRDCAVQVDALLTLAAAARALDGPGADLAYARQAVTVAASHGFVPGTLEAAVALAEALPPDDARREVLLAAVAADTRAPARVLHRARKAAAAMPAGIASPSRRAPTVPQRVEGALRAALGDALVTPEGAPWTVKEVPDGQAAEMP